MGLLKNEYKSFLDDIEKNIKNKEDLDYIKERFVSFMDIVLNEMDRIMEYKEEKMEQLENTQKQLIILKKTFMQKRDLISKLYVHIVIMNLL